MIENMRFALSILLSAVMGVITGSFVVQFVPMWGQTIIAFMCFAAISYIKYSGKDSKDFVVR